ncbi:MAG: hypothetical protein GWO21_04255, partial [Gammaproteobacteria bacterium]|nr:hypothetical protein [Gammaproteobacteria bacterium]
MSAQRHAGERWDCKRGDWDAFFRRWRRRTGDKPPCSRRYVWGCETVTEAIEKTGSDPRDQVNVLTWIECGYELRRGLPLAASGETLGIVNPYEREGRLFTKHEVEILRRAVWDVVGYYPYEEPLLNAKC